MKKKSHEKLGKHNPYSQPELYDDKGRFQKRSTTRIIRTRASFQLFLNINLRLYKCIRIKFFYFNKNHQTYTHNLDFLTSFISLFINPINFLFR